MIKAHSLMYFYSAIFQNIRKRGIHNLNSEEETKSSRNVKAYDNLVPMPCKTNAIQDISGMQQQPSINNVAVDVEVHYTESNINNNSNQRNIALDMAKITAGAPGNNRVFWSTIITISNIDKE